MEKILKSIARIFGVNDITEDAAQQKLDETLSFEQLKNQATEAAKEEFQQEISALKKKNVELQAKLDEANSMIDDQKKEISNLANRVPEKHTASETDTDNSENKPAYEETPINKRVAELRAAKERLKY